MAKFYGLVGFVLPSNVGNSVYEEIPEERVYRGEVIKNSRQWENGVGLNDDISLSNSISIISDEYSDLNFANIRYIKWRGFSWKVTNVQIQRPRLILTIGGVYNGPTIETGCDSC